VSTLFQFQVPATSAHLGPGFGVLAAALKLLLKVTVTTRAEERHEVERMGNQLEPHADPRHDVILRALHVAAERFTIKLPPGLHFRVESEIPPACGLGTASAGFAAGLGTAFRLAKHPPHLDALLDLLVELGGDPAHGAAALAGGLTAACSTTVPGSAETFHLVRYPLHHTWRFVLALPNTTIATADARRVLPASLPHPVLGRTTGRVLGLLQALGRGDEELLGACVRDEVHVPFRRRLVHGMEEAMAAGREAGAAGVTISGNGPAVVGFTTDHKRGTAIAQAMGDAFRRAGVAAGTRILQASFEGALPADQI
jgi:homoserine kinase